MYTNRRDLMFFVDELSFRSEQERHVVLFVWVLSFFSQYGVIFPDIWLDGDIGFGHTKNEEYLLTWTSIYRIFPIKL